MRDPRNSFYRHLELDKESQEAVKLYRFIKAKMLRQPEARLEVEDNDSE